MANGAEDEEGWFLCKDCGDRVFPPGKLPEHASCKTLRHPAQKPMELTRRLLLSAVSGNGVLIPFAGSGSECIVARQLNSEFFATEINEEYAEFGNKWLEHMI